MRIRIILMVIIFSALQVSLAFAQEESSSKPKTFLDTLEGRSDMYLLYVIEYGSFDAKVKSFQILSERGSTSQDVLDTAHKYLSYGYDSIISEGQAPLGSWEIRYWAMQVAKGFNDQSSIPFVLALLDVEDDTRVIRSAVNSLGDIKSSNSLDTLLMILSRNKNNPAIVTEVIISLGKIGDPRALYDLIQISENNFYRENIRTLAAEAAGKLEEPKYRPATTSVDIRQAETSGSSE